MAGIGLRAASLGFLAFLLACTGAEPGAVTEEPAAPMSAAPAPPAPVSTAPTPAASSPPVPLEKLLSWRDDAPPAERPLRLAPPASTEEDAAGGDRPQRFYFRNRTEEYGPPGHERTHRETDAGVKVQF